MKKISTKIVFLSIINTLIIAVFNVVSSMYMMRGDNSAQTPAGTSAAGQTLANHISFMIPTPVLLALLASLVIGIIISYLMGRYISKPIKKITEIANKTSDFDLAEDESIRQILKYKDESGAMAKALLNIRKALRDMAARLQDMSSSLASHSQNLSTTTDETVKSITQVSATINEIAEGNSNQARTISDINDTLAEVVNLIDNAAKGTHEGAESAVNSLDIIKNGQNSVEIQMDKMNEFVAVSNEANQSINELGQMIEHVTGIVSVITSIAEQTNLLSLNAAIEAARVGEAGRGFAVVAEEIRGLAEESSKSANQIVDIIKNTTEKAKLAVTNMNKANLLIDDQKKAVGVTQDAFSNIKTAYNNIVDNFQNTAQSMKTINGKSNMVLKQTQDMSVTAEESAASTQEVSASGQEQLASIEMISGSAKSLLSLAENLKNETNRFKIQ